MSHITTIKFSPHKNIYSKLMVFEKMFLYENVLVVLFIFVHLCLFNILQYGLLSFSELQVLTITLTMNLCILVWLVVLLNSSAFLCQKQTWGYWNYLY